MLLYCYIDANMNRRINSTSHRVIIIIIISGFGIYGAAVVPDSGVGNTWQRLLTLNSVEWQ